jgi:hypothetical protein
VAESLDADRESADLLLGWRPIQEGIGQVQTLLLAHMIDDSSHRILWPRSGPSPPDRPLACTGSRLCKALATIAVLHGRHLFTNKAHRRQVKVEKEKEQTGGEV